MLKWNVLLVLSESRIVMPQALYDQGRAKWERNELSTESSFKYLVRESDIVEVMRS